MDEVDVSFAVSRLGECRIPTPLKGIRYISDEEQVLYHGTLKDVENLIRAGKTPPCFEMAGPREKIYFDPSTLACGIVTCGGLCPGLKWERFTWERSAPLIRIRSTPFAFS